MGYKTTFEGKLTFKNEITGKELSKLKSMFGEDCRKHPEWGRQDLFYIDLKLSDDFDGIEWNEDCEKTYDLTDIVNLVISQMQKDFPDFGLEGQLNAQGEDPDDRWILKIIENKAFTHELKLVEVAATCPHCGKSIA